MKAISFGTGKLTEEVTPPPARTTADMVAKAANVSRVAVSRAFNPNASLKPEKRERILRIARELNYAPDMAGRALVTRRSHLVGVVVPEVCSPWESQEIDALTTALQSAGFATLLFKTRTDRTLDGTLLSYMKAYNPDSVVVFTENVPRAQLRHVFERAIPVYVEYPEDEAVESFALAPGEPPYDRLRVLMMEGISHAVAMLAAYGRRRIAYLSGNPLASASVARHRVLSRALAARGLPPEVRLPGDFSYETAYAATVGLFRVGEGADAIFAANDVSAFGAMDALRHELKLRVPGDVNVVGFDDVQQAAWRSYNLTTVRLDLEERVHALVRLILTRIRKPQTPPLTETIRTRLVVRGTVG